MIVDKAKLMDDKIKYLKDKLAKLSKQDDEEKDKFVWDL